VKIQLIQQFLVLWMSVFLLAEFAESVFISWVLLGEHWQSPQYQMGVLGVKGCGVG